MRLTGACSNPDVARLVAAAAERKRQILLGCARTSRRPLPQLRLPLGAIQTAVLDVLADDASGVWRPREICACVEARLQRSISQDTISSFLSVASRSTKSPVRRVGRGLYQLAD